MNIEGKVYVGQFHRALLAANEYVICIAKQIEPNVYELYSVLSPKTGLLHMQVSMGESLAKHKAGVQKEKNSLVCHFNANYRYSNLHI